MKFERLNSSIALNAKETPSIYMAMCMIESLFRDVEDASGTELCRTALGDEQLPTKLIWLSRILLKIYSENSESMLRNRDRLVKMLEKVKEQEQSLKELEETSKALHEAQLRSASLEAQLRQAEEARQEVERLEASCKQVRDRLKLLEELNPEAIRAELEQLSTRERELTAQRAEMKQALEQHYDSISELEFDCEDLEKNAVQCQNRLDELKSEKRNAENELADLNAGIATWEKELSAHSQEKDKLIEEQAYLEEQVTQLRQDVEDYERVNMAPLRQEFAQYSEKRDGMKAELDTLKRDRDEAVLQVARLSQQVSSARSALEEKQKDLLQKQQAASLAAEETDRLKATLDAETNRLAELQKLASDLEHNQLPQLENLIQEQTKQNKQYTDSIAGLEERKEKLLLEVERLKEDDKALSAQVASLKETHDALVASSEANDEAVRKLRQDVEELRGRNDREKQMRYRQQLEEELQRLRALGQSCAELERQLAASQGNLEREEQRLSALRGKKQTADEANRRISALIQELAPLGDAALQRRVTALQNRQHLLEESHKKLEESISMMQSVLDLPAGSLSLNPDGLSESLQVCGRTLDKLQKSLIKCANAVKNEIKIEPNREEQ